MPSLTQTLLLGAAFSTIMMLFAWLFFFVTNRATIVDSFWVLTVTTLSLFYTLTPTLLTSSHFTLSFLILIWGIRLFFYLIYRFISYCEDPRYQYFKKRAVNRRSKFFLKIFLFQGFCAFLLTLPFAIYVRQILILGNIKIVGVIICIMAIIGESIADFQLAKFKKVNKGKADMILNKGLWKYSRHPNYFFEWLFWIGVTTFMYQQPFRLMILIPPILMFTLLYFVTGVKFSEEIMRGKKGPTFEKYLQSTSSFVPWKPKK